MKLVKWHEWVSLAILVTVVIMLPWGYYEKIPGKGTFIHYLWQFLQKL